MAKRDITAGVTLGLATLALLACLPINFAVHYHVATSRPALCRILYGVGCYEGVWANANPVEAKKEIAYGRR